jgi:hypothetical protein
LRPARPTSENDDRPVAPSVHVISGFANGNILVVEGGMDLLLVDAQSGKRVALADSALAPSP